VTRTFLLSLSDIAIVVLREEKLGKRRVLPLLKNTACIENLILRSLLFSIILSFHSELLP